MCLLCLRKKVGQRERKAQEQREAEKKRKQEEEEVILTVINSFLFMRNRDGRD